jgi:hypothetical protein
MEDDPQIEGLIQDDTDGITMIITEAIPGRVHVGLSFPYYKNRTLLKKRLREFISTNTLQRVSLPSFNFGYRENDAGLIFMINHGVGIEVEALNNRLFNANARAILTVDYDLVSILSENILSNEWQIVELEITNGGNVPIEGTIPVTFEVSRLVIFSNPRILSAIRYSGSKVLTLLARFDEYPYVAGIYIFRRNHKDCVIKLHIKNGLFNTKMFNLRYKVFVLYYLSKMKALYQSSQNMFGKDGKHVMTAYADEYACAHQLMDNPETFKKFEVNIERDDNRNRNWAQLEDNMYIDTLFEEEDYVIDENGVIINT